MRKRLLATRLRKRIVTPVSTLLTGAKGCRCSCPRINFRSFARLLGDMEELPMDQSLELGLLLPDN
jgi:hypothetical protein